MAELAEAEILKNQRLRQGMDGHPDGDKGLSLLYLWLTGVRSA